MSDPGFSDRGHQTQWGAILTNVYDKNNENEERIPL